MIDKKLISCNGSQTIKSDETRSFAAETDTPCSKVKAFVWNNNFVPLIVAFEKLYKNYAIIAYLIKSYLL